MKTIALTLLAGLLATAAGTAQAAGLDLSKYQVSIATTLGKNMPVSRVYEAGAITYNWDRDSLLAIGDEAHANEFATDGGVFPDAYDYLGVSSYNDPEGVTYVGNGQYVFAEERTTRIWKVGLDDYTVDMGGGRTRRFFEERDPAYSYTVSGGDNWGNQGLEGISYDPVTGGFFAVKETNSQRVMFIDWDFNTANAGGTTTDLFDASLLGLNSLSDIATLSTVDAFGDADFRENLLILSAKSNKLLEVTRAGEIVSEFDLSGIFNDISGLPISTIEGVTVGADGSIYLAAELGGISSQGGLSSFIKLSRVQTAAVPEPATWAMMLGGLGLVGGAMRRRKVSVAFA